MRDLNTQYHYQQHEYNGVVVVVAFILYNVALVSLIHDI